MPKELLLIKFLEERHPSVLFLDQEVDYQSYNQEHDEEEDAAAQLPPSSAALILFRLD